jgi:hypothetical protein
MAGEVLGKTYEAMTRVALSFAGIPDERVFWDQRPKWMSINADFVIGKELDKPSMIILCSHSTSTKESEKKFWRNAQEFFETKASVKIPLPAYNIIFNKSYKAKLLSITTSIFDGHLEISEQPYGEFLLKTGSKLAAKDFKTIGAEPMVEKLLQKCDQSNKTYNKELHTALKAFASDLKKLFKGVSIEFQKMWPLIRQEYQSTKFPKKSVKTYVKRGIGKLTLFTESERKEIYDHVNERKDLDNLPDFVAHLEYFSQTLTGYILEDGEIRSVIEYLGREQIKRIIAESPLDRMMTLFISPVRNVNNLKLFHQYLLANYKKLIRQPEMEKSLIKCFENPMRMLDKKRIEGSIEKVWLVEYLFSLFKSLEGKQQAYGYSKLEQDMNISDPSSIRFWGPAFVAREKLPDKEQLSELARCLSTNLSEYDIGDIKNAFENSIKRELNSLIEAKLLPYRSFDPIGYLVQKSLDDAKIGWQMVKAHPSFLSEYADVAAATTKVLLTNQKPPVLIKWQSCHGGHVSDKRKELAARATSMKFEFTETKGFKKREYSAFIFIADGDWRDEDFDVLQKSGWDHIFYPHEMNELIELLKKLEFTKTKIIKIPETELPLAAEKG